ncbi:hypothetical protein [Micromonospora sp. NPDC004704]
MHPGIDTVDWSKLRHAYGTAEDVPANLRELADEDESVRHGAFGELWSSLVHQGSRYEASAYAVPFLLDLVADPATPDRFLVARFLALVAIGSDEAWLPDGIDVDHLRTRADGGEQALRRYREGADLAPEDHGRIDAHADLTAWEAVRDGLPVLRALLREDDSDLRTVVAYTLGWFPATAAPEHAAASLAALAEIAAGTDEGPAAVAVVAAGLLGADGADRIASAALDSGSPLVRWAGGVALARLHGPAAGAAVAAELLRWAGGGSRPDHRIPYLDGDLAGYATLALGRLGAAHADAAFAANLARLPLVHAVEALTVLGEALRYAFPSGPVPAGTPFESLDPDQKHLVRVLADAPDTWRYDQLEFGNFSMLIGEYGLPNPHARLRAYVYDSPASAVPDGR